MRPLCDLPAWPTPVDGLGHASAAAVAYASHALPLPAPAPSASRGGGRILVAVLLIATLLLAALKHVAAAGARASRPRSGRCRTGCWLLPQPCLPTTTTVTPEHSTAPASHPSQTARSRWQPLSTSPRFLIRRAIQPVHTPVRRASRELLLHPSRARLASAEAAACLPRSTPPSSASLPPSLPLDAS